MEKLHISSPEKEVEAPPSSVDDLQLRRSDHEDAKEIEAFIEESKVTTYKRVFAGVDIMNFIETSFLSITVLSPEGKIVAFASFDHSPIVKAGSFEPQNRRSKVS